MGCREGGTTTGWHSLSRAWGVGHLRSAVQPGTEGQGRGGRRPCGGCCPLPTAPASMSFWVFKGVKAACEPAPGRGPCPARPLFCEPKSAPAPGQATLWVRGFPAARQRPLRLLSPACRETASRQPAHHRAERASAEASQGGGGGPSGAGQWQGNVSGRRNSACQGPGVLTDCRGVLTLAEAGGTLRF